jgi:haloalkane dehalogenase
VRDEGDGVPVVMIHGVPVSSFLWRKVVADLAARGLRGVAFDLPGLGLADRPRRHDYSWTGLGRFAHQVVDELDLDSFHLVVHDIGGPVGFELLGAVPGRVRSLTVLDTMIHLDTFRRPWPMELFARRGVGEVWLATAAPRVFATLMRRIGVADQRAVTDDELIAHLELLKREDGGRAFLEVMRSFELVATKRLRYYHVLGGYTGPTQVIWGTRDTALPMEPHAYDVMRAAGDGARLHELDAKHFLQEDRHAEVAELIAAQASSA